MEIGLFSEEERTAILRQYRQLLQKAKPVLKKNDAERVHAAFQLALEAHRNMRRKSGEPYIFHPLAVAEICIKEIGLGVTSLIGALLHDVVEDTQYTLADIYKQFGEEVGEIVDGLTKISSVSTQSTSVQAENLRRVLLTISKDARIILIKIADRLHNMRTLNSLTRNKQIRISSETIYLYAPLAHRLGLYNIKTALEDLYLKYVEPDAYAQVAQKINETKTTREHFIRNFIRPLKKRIQEHGIRATFKGRPKSIHSIWHKMQRQSIPFEEVYDLFAIRIIIDAPPEQEKALCWRVYAIITDNYMPNANRFKDWISISKANGYESLHTTVMSHQGQWVEIQIRSKRMDSFAEKGYAAHWKYKSHDPEVLNPGLSQFINTLRDMLENKTDMATGDFLKDFRNDLSREEIYVFTPKGDMRILPNGSCILDFAFEIHTELGKKCIGAKIDHKLLPIHHKLNNGDQVEILTSTKQAPRIAWLKHVASSKANSAIKQYVKTQHNEQTLAGKLLLQEQAKKQHISLDVANMQLLITHFGYQHTTELYYAIGAGHVERSKIRALKDLLHGLKPLGHKKKITPTSKPPKNTQKERDNLLIGDNLDTVDYKISPCCNPIPGDEVFGFVTGYDGIKIHRTTCRNAPELLSQHGERIMRAQWASTLRSQSLANVELKGIDRIGIMQDIMHLISNQFKVNTKSVSMRGDSGLFTGELKIFVQDIAQLRHVIQQIKKIKGIAYVIRTDT